MKELLFSNEVTLEDDRIMKLDYSLTHHASKENPAQLYYGVHITKVLSGVTETDEIMGISSSKEVTASILEKLCQFAVTPITMAEIVDELVTLGN